MKKNLNIEKLIKDTIVLHLGLNDDYFEHCDNSVLLSELIKEPLDFVEIILSINEEARIIFDAKSLNQINSKTTLGEFINFYEDFLKNYKRFSRKTQKFKK